MFPEKQPSRATVITNDGKVFTEYIEYPKGDPREPMTIEDIDNKFSGLAEELLSTEKQRQIKEMILGCEKYDVSKFMSKLII